MFSHIVAASENNIIGTNNELPWKLSDDFKYFKNTTWGMPVIMGRKTFESLKKDLPGRINIVLTKETNWQSENVFVVHTIDAALAKALESGCKEIFIIGGGEIFKQTFDLVDKIYLTRVHTTIDGDTSYPVMDSGKWEKIKSTSFPADARNNYPFTLEVWKKSDKV